MSECCDRTHVYVVDDERASRIQLVRIVGERGFIGRPFTNAADLVDELPHLPCGIVVIDILNSGPNGFDVIEAVARQSLAWPIIAMTAAADAHIAVAALKRGAIDFLEKPLDNGAVAEALLAAEEIMRRRRAIFEQTGLDGAALARLSEREREVLAAMVEGKTSKMISLELGIGVRTVEAYRASLIDKLEVGTAAGAIALLVRFETAQLAHAGGIAQSTRR